MPSVLVSLSSFGAAEVGRHGQLWFAKLALAAGADSVEVRGELLREPEAELASMRGLASVYSSAELLWKDDGTWDSGALDRGLHAAQVLGAARLKMSIGGFDSVASQTLPALRQRLKGQQVELVIENDQTVSAGTLPALQAFFKTVDQAGFSLGMTFDMGNWHWLGECPIAAAVALASRVRYVHCKGVQRTPGKWIAVRLEESMAPWRTLLRALPDDVPRAIEFPLGGDDLLAVAREQIALLRSL
jgi:hypothetical protein